MFLARKKAVTFDMFIRQQPPAPPPTSPEDASDFVAADQALPNQQETTTEVITQTAPPPLPATECETPLPAAATEAPTENEIPAVLTVADACIRDARELAIMQYWEQAPRISISALPASEKEEFVNFADTLCALTPDTMERFTALEEIQRLADVNINYFKSSETSRALYEAKRLLLNQRRKFFNTKF